MRPRSWRSRASVRDREDEVGALIAGRAPRESDREDVRVEFASAAPRDLAEQRVLGLAVRRDDLVERNSQRLA
jgi:hypothetical protein